MVFGRVQRIFGCAERTSAGSGSELVFMWMKQDSRHLGSWGSVLIMTYLRSPVLPLLLSVCPHCEVGADTALGAVGPLSFAAFMPGVDLHLLGGAWVAWKAGEPKGQPGPVRDGVCCSFPGSQFESLSLPEKPAGVNFSLLFPPRASARRELQFANLPVS